jgi:acid phosphatase
VDGIGAYMEGAQYIADAEGVNQAALSFLKSLQLNGDGKDVVVFDIDETALSNLPYYRNHKYGGEPYNYTAYSLWVAEGQAPALPTILQLVEDLQAANFGIVFLSGRSESQRSITTKNLEQVGYKGWIQLILKSPEEGGTTAAVYKSKKRTELSAQGYHIYSTIGDQWSDITGPYVGNRTFKVPNPMYFIA